MGRSRRPRTRRATPCTERGRGGLRAALVLAAAAALGAGCTAAAGSGSEAARAWAAGPARWLLLPDERAALARVDSAAELSAFLQAFWRRRDDDPATPEVPLGEVYAQRVAAADRLYAEEGLRGALTDRGGTLLLLGPPSILSYSSREAPSWDARRSGGRRPTRPVRLEIWTWLRRDLPPEIAARLEDELAADGEVTLTFLLGPRRTRLIEGRHVLGRAACAWARCDAPP